MGSQPCCVKTSAAMRRTIAPGSTLARHHPFSCLYGPARPGGPARHGKGRLRSFSIDGGDGRAEDADLDRTGRNRSVSLLSFHATPNHEAPIMAFGFGKKWWKRASGLSSAQRKLSRQLGVRLSDFSLGSSRGMARTPPSRPPATKVAVVCPHCGVKNNYMPRSVGTVRQCQACNGKVLLTDAAAAGGFPHAVHFVLTILSCGLWSPV